MKESQITRPEDLDAALVGKAVYKREKLWRAAEGRFFLRADLIGIVVGAVLILGSLYNWYFEQDDGTLTMVIGLVVVGTAAYRRQQLQISALRELLKLSEREPQQRAPARPSHRKT